MSLSWQFLHLQAEQMNRAIGDWSYTLGSLRSQVFDILDFSLHGMAHVHTCVASENVPGTPGSSVFDPACLPPGSHL